MYGSNTMSPQTTFVLKTPDGIIFAFLLNLCSDFNSPATQNYAGLYSSVSVRQSVSQSVYHCVGSNNSCQTREQIRFKLGIFGLLNLEFHVLSFYEVSPTVGVGGVGTKGRVAAPPPALLIWGYRVGGGQDSKVLAQLC